ncbi:MAG: hypothetical protein QNJ70_18700 [Xenococcaceae cyanobacterium MO_207.B15]|nr:hypothetical protein [Xenococcaceae cyanobacterium MO_207.B15]
MVFIIQMASMTRRFLTLLVAVTAIVLVASVMFNPGRAKTTDFWQIYDTALKSAKYVDLTHAFSPTIPVWHGFDNATFDSTGDRYQEDKYLSRIICIFPSSP